MAGAMLAWLGGKAKSSQKHPNIYAPYPLIKDFDLSEFLISSILAACFICSRVFLMEFDRFHQFGSLLLHDDFVLSYSGYVTNAICLTLSQLGFAAKSQAGLDGMKCHRLASA